MRICLLRLATMPPPHERTASRGSHNSEARVWCDELRAARAAPARAVPLTALKENLLTRTARATAKERKASSPQMRLRAVAVATACPASFLSSNRRAVDRLPSAVALRAHGTARCTGWVNVGPTGRSQAGVPRSCPAALEPLSCPTARALCQVGQRGLRPTRPFSPHAPRRRRKPSISLWTARRPQLHRRQCGTPCVRRCAAASARSPHPSGVAPTRLRLCGVAPTRPRRPGAARTRQ